LVRASFVTLGLLLAVLSTATSWAQETWPVVYVARIEGTIDLGLAPFTRRVLDEAAAAGAAAVVLEINTFGGRVDAAVVIRDALLATPLTTVAFIDKRAISAGALISLAAKTIAMADGATIGAATPVQAGAEGAQPVSEKTVSYMRKEFRATAESRGRPPLMAEAMVDPDVVIPGVIEKGKLLTLTTTEALKHKVADFRGDGLPAVLDRLGLGAAEVRRVSENWAEHVVRFLTHPILSSVLMTVGMLGIVVELRTPGFGVPGALGITSLALFFWGHWLVRLAGWEEVLLVAVGLALLALEIFIIPGFGVAGILGMVALGSGFTLSLIGAGATWELVLDAVGRVTLSALLAVAGFAVFVRFLPRLPFGQRLVLDTALGALSGAAPESQGEGRWLDQRGTTTSPLRPAGIAEIEGERVDVVSRGEYIEAGEPIEVIRIEGNRIVVRRARGQEE
jgi:membrane-bound serine protease (ClpP class)